MTTQVLRVMLNKGSALVKVGQQFVSPPHQTTLALFRMCDPDRHHIPAHYSYDWRRSFIKFESPQPSDDLGVTLSNAITTKIMVLRHFNITRTHFAMTFLTLA